MRRYSLAWLIRTDAGGAVPASSVDALIWGAALGAASGAVLGDAIDGVGAGVGRVVGAAVYAPAEVITTMSRRGAEIKPLWQRIFSSALLMALFGWLLGLISASTSRCSPRSSAARSSVCSVCAR